MKSLHPSMDGWLENVWTLMRRYYIEDGTPEIKVKVCYRCELLDARRVR